ncbi:MAG: hypothetical protein KBC81_02470 [Candidatus Pacebacteria bacterium]|nr:hypothetical protein [Candidatus Paceibacterota bacterium]
MKLNIHPHFTKAVIGYILLVLIASVGIWVYVAKFKYNKTAKELPPPNFKVSEYSVSGKVSVVKGFDITVNVPRVMVGDNGNYVLSEDKVFALNPNTKIYLVSRVGDKIVKKAGTIKDIVSGKNVTIYSWEDMAHLDKFGISHVDVTATK